MARIPLKEYKKPRILAVDFAENEVKKIIKAGFNAKRAFTGLYDNDEYCIPTAIQDTEIILFNYKKGTFENREQRKKRKDSIPDDFDFHLVAKETFNKGGWLILFIGEDSDPKGLEYLYIRNLGFTWTYDGYKAVSEFRSDEYPPTFPVFKGETLKINEYDLGTLLKRFYESGNWVLLNIKRGVTFKDVEYDQIWIITDDAASPSALAIEIVRKFHDVHPRRDESGRDMPPLIVERYGGIIVLPDFGKKNVEVALSIIQNYINDKSPTLFSDPIHDWLKEYKPESVKQLYIKMDELKAKQKKEMKELGERIEQEEIKYSWLDTLIVGMDDDFKNSVGTALDFLGFKIKDIDKDLSPDERKREDFNIVNPTDKSFYIGEAKATKRGASEDFITKTQNHQANYSREHNCPVPDAILIVNHSHNLDPSYRSERFYKDSEVIERLKDQQIKAIDSFALHAFCQKVLAKELTKEEAREFIRSINGACSGYNA